MKIQRMKTNRIVNPLGFDLKTPVVSWTVEETEAKKQLWARVEVAADADFSTILFDTGGSRTASSLGVPVEIALSPRTLLLARYGLRRQRRARDERHRLV